MKYQANFKKVELWILHRTMENDIRKMGFGTKWKEGKTTSIDIERRVSAQKLRIRPTWSSLKTSQ